MITRIFKHELHELNKSFETDRDHTPSPSREGWGEVIEHELKTR